MFDLLMDKVSRWLRDKGERDAAERWHCDPLSHPALAAMDQAQLGDLPLRSARMSCAC